MKRYLAAALIGFLAIPAVGELPPGTYLRIDPTDLYVVGPPDPNEPPVDPCEEDPEADGCPCPFFPEYVYPDCPNDQGLPVAYADRYTLDQVPTANVMDNDIDAEWIVESSYSSACEFTIRSDGTFDVVPPPDWDGNENECSFRYRAVNDFGQSEKRVNVWVSDPDGPPPVDPCDEDPSLPECDQPPRPDVTYRPNLPPIGEYAVPDVCLPIHDESAASVTLGDLEPLQDALARLKAESPEGGVINVPWDVATIQCDSLRNLDNKSVPNLTIKGSIGPTGERPRFYCRSVKLGGTVEEGYGGTFMMLTAGQIMMESLHVDGYGKWFQSGQSGNYRFRNNYGHHATNDGNGVNGIDEGSTATGANIEYCGNEFSHGGQGNAKHTFYMHRGTEAAPIKIKLISNTIHSTNWSSGFKSTANSNQVVGNKFYKTVPPKDAQPSNPDNYLETDPSYEVKYSQMMVDIVSCSDTQVVDNYFYHWRPEPNGYAGGWMLNFRNRKGIQGCDVPKGYIGDNTTAVPDYENEFWSEEYWDEISGTYPQTVQVIGNTFETVTDYAKATAVWTMGTYPNIAARQFGPACLLESPEWWYERHKVYMRDNVFIGDGITRTEAEYPGHSESCDWPIPDTADKRSLDMFIIDEPPEPESCVPQEFGELYPECPVTYMPPLPVGPYTDGYCEDMTPAPFKVVLQDRETLRDASIRLAELSDFAGGTLAIPYDADIIQCDDLRIGNPNRMTGPLVITGQLGPNGERPRLYCRSADRDGTVPNKEVTGEAFYMQGDFDILIENVHVDGYKKFMSGNGDKKIVLRNNYMHHGMSDGISNSNMEGDRRLTIEFCGNEIAHFGQGNTVHNIYMHRGLSGAGDTGLDGSSKGWNRLVIVDSILHSSPFSDAFKSIANENVIKNNSIHSTLDTDPTYTKRYSSMLADVPACSINRIEGNTFYSNKPVATSYGSVVVGIRNRKRTLRGCDLPAMWTPYDRPPVKIDGPAHSEPYWTALMGAIQFPTQILNNTFISQGEFDDRKDVIAMYGTYPNTEERLGGSACFLPTPMTWYERARVYADGNTYIGHPKEKIYFNAIIGHHSSCSWERPEGPGPEHDMIEIGPNETIR